MDRTPTGFLICAKFTAQFKRILKDSGIEVILTPRQAPNCNSFAERFVLSIKSECLWKLIFFGEASFRRAVPSYVEHYHEERPHQSLENAPIDDGTEQPPAGPVRCHE